MNVQLSQQFDVFSSTQELKAMIEEYNANLKQGQQRINSGMQSTLNQMLKWYANTCFAKNNQENGFEVNKKALANECNYEDKITINRQFKRLSKAGIIEITQDSKYLKRGYNVMIWFPKQILKFKKIEVPVEKEETPLLHRTDDDFNELADDLKLNRVNTLKAHTEKMRDKFFQDFKKNQVEDKRKELSTNQENIEVQEGRFKAPVEDVEIKRRKAREHFAKFREWQKTQREQGLDDSLLTYEKSQELTEKPTFLPKGNILSPKYNTELIELDKELKEHQKGNLNFQEDGEFSENSEDGVRPLENERTKRTSLTTEKQDVEKLPCVVPTEIGRKPMISAGFIPDWMKPKKKTVVLSSREKRERKIAEKRELREKITAEKRKESSAAAENERFGNEKSHNSNEL